MFTYVNKEEENGEKDHVIPTQIKQEENTTNRQMAKIKMKNIYIYVYTHSHLITKQHLYFLHYQIKHKQIKTRNKHYLILVFDLETKSFILFTYSLATTYVRPNSHLAVVQLQNCRIIVLNYSNRIEDELDPILW